MTLTTWKRNPITTIGNIIGIRKKENAATAQSKMLCAIISDCLVCFQMLVTIFRRFLEYLLGTIKNIADVFQRTKNQYPHTFHLKT